MPSRTTGPSTIDTGIDPAGFRALQKTVRGLKPTEPQWAKALGAANKTAAAVIVADAQARARAMGHEQEAAAGAIKAVSNQRSIKVRVSNTARIPFALTALWGQDRHTGWFAEPWFDDEPRPQHLPWVGNSWQVGATTGGPYALNPAIAAHKDEAVALWAAAIEQLMADVASR